MFGLYCCWGCSFVPQVTSFTTLYKNPANIFSTCFSVFLPAVQFLALCYFFQCTSAKLSKSFLLSFPSFSYHLSVFSSYDSPYHSFFFSGSYYSLSHAFLPILCLMHKSFLYLTSVPPPFLLKKRKPKETWSF